MADVPVELQRLRTLWQSLEAVKGVNQATLVRRSKTVSHLVPGFSGEKTGISGPYISQLLNPKLARTPRPPMLAAFALGMHALYMENRVAFAAEDRALFDDAFGDVLSGLRVKPTQWTEPDSPLEAYSTNLVVREQFESYIDSILETGRFSVLIDAGYRWGKTTNMARMINRCEGLGYAVTDVSVGSIAIDFADSADIYRQFGAAIGLPGEPAHDGTSLTAAMTAWLQGRLGTTVLFVDDVNALIRKDGNTGALVRTLLRDWAQRSSRSPDSSPWRRFCLVVARTFSPDLLDAAGVTSPAPGHGTTLKIEPFSPDEVRELIDLWAAHRDLDGTAAAPTGEDIEPWAIAICDWFAGHPYLVHDYVRTWAMSASPSRTWSNPGFKLSAGQDAYLSDLDRLLGYVVDSQSPLTHIGAYAAEGADELAVPISRQALNNVGVTDVSGAWTSPFLESSYKPRLASLAIERG